MKDEIKKLWKIKPEQRTTEEKLKLFLSDEYYGVAHIYKDGRLCHCNNKDIDGLYLDKNEADILLGFAQHKPEVKEVRILPVGSIKNKYLRRICLIAWHIPLVIISISMNAVIGFLFFIGASFRGVKHVNSDLISCWKSAKPKS